jgi:uracil-DNA glycosylase
MSEQINNKSNADIFPVGWETLFSSSKREFEHINRMIGPDIDRGLALPLKKDWFKAYEMIQPKDIKVVIVGQDPYPQYHNDGLPRAQGLSFSVSKGDTIPASLKNIFKELQATYPSTFTIPTSGDLTKWVENGVFLLNMALTVRAGEPGSHGRIWQGFIIRTLQEITKHNPKCIYMLWGNEAQKLKPFINDNAIVIEAGHPSGMNTSNPFFGSRVFWRADQEMAKLGYKMDWSL